VPPIVLRRSHSIHTREEQQVSAVSAHLQRKGQIRFPTLRDLFEEGRANPNLKAEKTYNYEVALEHAFPSIATEVEVVAFRINAQNFIERIDLIAENRERLRFQGIEIVTRYTGIDDLDLTFGYTLLQSTNLSSETDTSALQNRPNHKVSVGADYRFGWGMAAHLSYLFIGGNLSLSRTTPTQVKAQDDYHVLNIGLSQELGDGMVRLFGRIENLLDQNYSESFGFEQPGRTFIVGAEIRLGPK